MHLHRFLFLKSWIAFQKIVMMQTVFAMKAFPGNGEVSAGISVNYSFKEV